MLNNLEALISLHKFGSMNKAALDLRLSQSAISKRISNLENFYQKKLIEKSGRKSVLTIEGLALIKQSEPLITKLYSLLEETKPSIKKYSIGVSESILSTWGPKILLPIFESLGLEVQLHTHRSPKIIERLISSKYDLGICAGNFSTKQYSLISDHLLKEEMVLAGQSKALNSPILCIEKTSQTWKNIKPKLSTNPKNTLYHSNFRELESFMPIAQIVKNSDQCGLIPIGVAKELLPTHQYKSLRPKLYRDIQLIYQKSKLQESIFTDLISELKKFKY